MNDLSVPVAAGLKRHQPSAMGHRALKHNMRIDADKLTIVVGIAITRACRTGLM
jgi:hypothetical protein